MLGHFAFQLLGTEWKAPSIAVAAIAAIAAPRTICVLVAIAAFSNWDFA